MKPTNLFLLVVSFCGITRNLFCVFVAPTISTCVSFVSAETLIGNNENEKKKKKKRIAIIGGGIGGSFAARFLSQYDTGGIYKHNNNKDVDVDVDDDDDNSVLCQLDSIVVFDPSPHLSGDGDDGDHASVYSASGAKKEGEDVNRNEGDSKSSIPHQGPRVSSLVLKNKGKKTIAVELGASIFYSGNKYVSEVIDSDPNLIKVDPDDFDTDGADGDGNSNDDYRDDMPVGFGIYDGNGVWDLLSTGMSDWMFKFKLAYRYNIMDLIRMRKAVWKAATAFATIYDQLDKHPNTFFTSPDEMWNAVGLYEPTTKSFDEYLDEIGISKEKTEATLDSIRSTVFPFLLPVVIESVLPQPGRFRKELLTAISLCNYNQDNSRLNGLAGLVSFLPSQGELFKVRGGNDQIMSSAFKQARAIHSTHCGGIKHRSNLTDSIRHVQKAVTTVISDSGQMELWSADENLGKFDIVVLAAPLQQCQISFKTRHGMIVKKMPFDHGVVEGAGKEEDSSSSSSGGSGSNSVLPPDLPSSTKRRYTQTVTTIVRNATLQHEHFGLTKSLIPQAVSVTEHGKEVEGFSSISQLTADGTFKMFSSEPLSDAHLTGIFGPYHTVEQVQVWGGDYGGAYPDFDGGGAACRSAPFLLYSDDDGAALYYVNAVESSVAAMEISAVGAKAVSKLVARRIGLIKDRGGDDVQ